MKYYIGHPDNPISKTEKLFPEQILIKFNGGLFAIKEKMGGISLTEIHFQLFEEIPSDKHKMETLERYVKNARKAGIEIIAHAPFLKDKNISGLRYKPLNFDFVWAIVPNEYKSKRIMKIGENECFVKKAKFEDYAKLIKILGKLKIKVLTMHVSKSGIILDDSNWIEFLEFLKRIGSIAKKNNVKLAIETGGLHEKHIKDIIGLGCGINFDTAHYFLDMLKIEKNAKEANELTIGAFERFSKNVAVLHLSQTAMNYDAHLGLLNKNGVLTCNEPILRYIKEKCLNPYIILETKPDKKAIDYVRKIVE